MIKEQGKKAQMQISFGMIFSIILIVVFLGFAFYAIKTFISTGNNAKAGIFLDKIEGDIEQILKSSVAVSSKPEEYLLPSFVDFVCFVDFSSDSKGENRELFTELKRAGDDTKNLVFYPIKYTGFESATISHINLEETVNEENPLCIGARNGKISLILRKDYGEALITIEKP